MSSVGVAKSLVHITTNTLNKQPETPEAIVQAEYIDIIIPGSIGGENTGCRWMAACCLQLPLSQ